MGAPLAHSRDIKARRWKDGVPHSTQSLPASELPEWDLEKTPGTSKPGRAQAAQSRGLGARAWLSQTNPSLKQASLLSEGHSPIRRVGMGEDP